MVSTMEWWPEKHLISDNIPNDFALIILNRPLKLDPCYFIQLWNKGRSWKLYDFPTATTKLCIPAFYRITVDGGTDIWLNFKKTYCKQIQVKDVDLICGDFDSISPEAMSMIRSKGGTTVVHTPDQDETDFSKSLIELEAKIKDTHIRTVVVVSQTSGRLDQIMANINTLHRSQKFSSANRILLLCENSLSFLLRPGKHSIHIPPSLVAKQDWCALIPFREATLLRTTGLKWNLKDQMVQFGKQISTSNTYAANTKKVDVRTDQPVLFSMGITLL